jgi:hypothetical protein
MKIFSSDLEDEINLSENTLSEDGILDNFYNLYNEEGSFWGIEDNEGNILQFCWLYDNTWLVDIPVPPDFVNYQKKADYEECILIIRNILSDNKVNPVEGMVRVDTMNTTLDKVLENNS